MTATAGKGDLHNVVPALPLSSILDSYSYDDEDGPDVDDPPPPPRDLSLEPIPLSTIIKEDLPGVNTSGTQNTTISLLNVLSKWLIRNKTNKLDAQKYVTSLYSALSELALLNSSKPLKNLVDEQTPGGLNWQGVNELRKSGYYRLLEKSLKKIYKRL